MTDLVPDIMAEIKIALRDMRAPLELQAAVGSFRDTLPDADILDNLRDYNMRNYPRQAHGLIAKAWQ